jgi:hypothetical protein
MDEGSIGDWGGGGAGLTADASDWGGDYSSGTPTDWSLGGGGLSVNPAEFDFSSFDTGGIGMDNGNYSDVGSDAMSGGSAFDNLMNFFNKNPFGKFASSLIGNKNPALGQTLGMAKNAYNMGKDPTRGTAGSTFGGIAGGALGSLFGPIGSMAGGYIGSQVGKGAMGGSPAYSGPGPEGSKDSGAGQLLTGLGVLYQHNQNQKDIGGQIKNLSSMYGPNSSYAKVMEQQLARRDAASGRRSQYGPRSVELQAALANANSRNAPTLMGLNQQRMQNRGQLMQGIGYGVQQAGGLGNIYNRIFGESGGGTPDPTVDWVGDNGMDLFPGG